MIGNLSACKHRVERRSQILAGHGNPTAGPAGIKLAAINQLAGFIK